MSLADAREVVFGAAIRGARPEPELRVDEWSEEHMVLPRATAADAGDYRISRTPMARDILRALSPRHPAKRVVIMGASQLLKTQVAINWLCASAHLAPANMLALEPTDALTKRLSARFSKTIDVVPVLQKVFAPPRSRDNRNTVSAKDFEGGTLYLATAGSASNLAEIPARYIFLDEVDRMETSVGGEGDPIDLAEARATTFATNCKFLEVSSPTETGASKIESLYDQGTRAVYLVPCPHCRHHHELVLRNFRFEQSESGRVVRAWFQCPECGADIDESHKARMLRDAPLGGTAHWHARSDGDGETVSFHVSAFYAQPGSITWASLARQYARALERLDRGDPDGMRVFYNTRLALSYTHAMERTTAQDLQERAEPYGARTLPDPALVVTIAVDTQADRLEVQAEGWGPGLEHWLLDYHVIRGDPSDAPEKPGSVWARLDEYVATPFEHAGGGKPVFASCYLIDAGGANTQDVYNYGRARTQRGCIIIHGATRPNRPIISSAPRKVDVNWRGKKEEGGALLWEIGTDVAKDYLFNRLKPDADGRMHYHDGLPAEWFEMFLAERKKQKLRGGSYIRVWEKRQPGDRNEALDLSVYNLAAAHYLSLPNYSAFDWARLRARLVPAAPAAAAPVARPPAPAAPAAAPRAAPRAAPTGRRMIYKGSR